MIPQALATMTSNEGLDPSVYVDTGASSHMTNDAGILTNLVPYSGSDQVLVGNGSQLNITHIGDCNQYKNLKLNKVLLVPNIKKNLISVSQLVKDNSCICEFTDSEFIVKDRETGKILATGNRKGDLYALKKDAVAAMIAVRSGKAPADRLHDRLGHPKLKSIKALASQHLIEINSKNHIICSSCQVGKSCRLPFVLSNKTATAPLNKIHCDLWGPAPVPSFQNMKYYAIFVDDYSRFTWLYPLRKKFEFFTIFIKFQKLVENQF